MISCGAGRFLRDGKPWFVYSGEIHYFRLRPAEWPVHLRAARAAGLNAVSSYVPWLWHEPEDGRFDFAGRTHPQRDLERWLRAVAAHGLDFIARVGPVSNAELVNEGLPEWLLRAHPRITGRGHDLTNLPHTTLLAYHDPCFLEHAARWLDAVLPVIVRHAHPRGPVVLVQLDNEIGMVQWLQKAADRSPEADAMYREFLAGRYGGDLARLNAAHGSAWRSFEQVVQPASGDDRQPVALLLDWMGFYQHYFAAYFGFLRDRAAAHGLALPVAANIPQFYDFDVRGRGVFAPMTSMMFREFPERAPGVVLGGAYQMRRLDYENFHDVAITTEVLRMVGGPEAPILCAELQSGIMRDRPRLYPRDVALNLRTSAAHGLDALNAYMFSGGVNEPGMGAFGRWHEWQAAVAPDGTRRPHFEALREFGRLAGAFGPRLAATRKQVDVPVGFYAPYWTTEYLDGPAARALEWKTQHLFYDGLARLLQLAHLNTSLVDLERAGEADLSRHPALVVFALGRMDAETQAKLAAYRAAGGRLLLNPDLPVRDLAGAPCTILADALGVRVAGGRSGTVLLASGPHEILVQGGATCFAPGAAEVVAATADGEACGLFVPGRGGAGDALVLGFGMSHLLDTQVDRVREFAARLGVRPAVETEPDLQVTLRSDGSTGFLLVANYHDEPRSGAVRLVLPGERRAIRLPARGRITLEQRRAYLLPLHLPLAGGAVLRYATAEVLSVAARAGAVRLVLRGSPGGEAEVECVTRARTARVDGRRAEARRIGARLRVRFETTGREQALTLR